MKYSFLTTGLALLLVCFTAGCAAGPASVAAPQQTDEADSAAAVPHEHPARANGGPLSELQQAFDVTYYEIDMAIFPDAQRIEAHVTAHIYALEPPVERIELDLAQNYDVAQVRLTRETKLDFEHVGDKLYVDLGPELELSEDAIIPITIVYYGNPPVAPRPPWEGGFTWSEDAQGRHWVGVSCQLEGAKVWLPVKDHPASRADSLRMAIDVPKPYTVAANGLHERTSESLLSEDRHVWHWKTNYPTHNYNINITMGMFERHERAYRTRDGADMPVVFYVLEEDAHQAGQLLDMTVAKLEQLRHYFGEYGFTDEKFGLVHTPYLGMEHQTINAYGNDFEYTDIGGKRYDWLLLHEMGHEWWGNLITIDDWAEFWIHEGITTFTDALFLYDFYSPAVYYDKISEYIGNIRNHQPIIPGENLNSAEVYNHDVYYKGAYFMHTLMHLMGRPVFLEAIRSFAEANRYAYSSTDALMKHFQRYTPHPLRPLFELYLYDVRLPEFQLTLEEEGDEGEQSQYVLELKNAGELQQAHGEDLAFPLEIQTFRGLEQHTLGAEPIVIESATRPVVDPDAWYLHAGMDFLE
ncbi:MAG: M1 family metallopeptidase [Cyclonatronaceae bacterium]